MGPELALAFSAGMVATVNPCGFAMLPAYLSYFLGLEAPRDGNGPDDGLDPEGSPVLRALAVSAAVTAGFLVVFAVMGFAWTSVSGLVGRRLPYFTIVVGFALVALGIAMIRGFEPVLRLPKLQLSSNGRQLSSMFLYGISYAIASLSCTIPIFIGIVSTTLEHTSFAAGLATFVAYGLGMGMTLAILTLAVALARSGIVRTFRRLLPHINTISGVFLIVAGLFVSYYAAVEIRELRSGGSTAVVKGARDIQSAMQRWVERVGGDRLALAATIVLVAAVAISWVWRSGRNGRSGDAPTSPSVAPDTGVATEVEHREESGR
ncbi:MAG: cytochrome c biogenesis CcdA family protein [Microthrixaceae bacterium]